ncbi:MAG: hypothetical protein JXR13_07100 [Thalassovita sp.]
MADLDMQIEKARQRLRNLQGKAQKLKRSDDTRRKVIYGAAVLKLLDDSMGEKAERLQKLLHERITRNRDRVFLGLQELHPNSPMSRE